MYSLMLMLSQYSMWQCAVPQEFYRAVEVTLQPLAADAGVGVVVQRFVDAGDGLDLLQHGADVVAHEDDGAILVDFCQQLVEAGFETLVDVGAGFVQDHYFGVGDDGASQEGALQLSAAEGADGALLHAFQSHAGYHGAGLLAVPGGEAGSEGFLAAQSRQDNFFHGDGELAVDAAVLRQIAHREFGTGSRCFAARSAAGTVAYLSGSGFQQAENALYQRSLSTAVRSDDAEEITVVDGEVHVAKHGSSVVAGAEVFYFDNPSFP